MNNTEQGTEASAVRTLCEQLKTIDSSLFFLLLIIVSVLISFWTVTIQRKGLCFTICGDTKAAGALPRVYPFKCKSSAIVVGSLGFFLCLALAALGAAESGDDCVAKKSARTNFIASLLVFLAAVLRLDDLRFVERSRPTLVAEDTLPD